MSHVLQGRELVEHAVRRAAVVPGWMRPSELRWLAEQAQVRLRIVEFGSFQGRSAKAIATTTPGTLWCVDPWQEISCIPPHVRIWDAFRRHHAEEIRVGKVVPVRMKSGQVAPWFAGVGIRPDMVFIDGRHEYEAVLQDIQVAIELLGGRGAGGLLCGHDYAPEWPGVVRAVDELVPERRLPATEPSSIWAVQL